MESMQHGFDSALITVKCLRSGATVGVIEGAVELGDRILVEFGLRLKRFHVREGTNLPQKEKEYRILDSTAVPTLHVSAEELGCVQGRGSFDRLITWDIRTGPKPRLRGVDLRFRFAGRCFGEKERSDQKHCEVIGERAYSGLQELGDEGADRILLRLSIESKSDQTSASSHYYDAMRAALARDACLPNPPDERRSRNRRFRYILKRSERTG